MIDASLLEKLNVSLCSVEEKVASGDENAIDALLQACQAFTEAVQNNDMPSENAARLLGPTSIGKDLLANLHERLSRLTSVLLDQQNDIRDELRRLGRSRIALRGYGNIRPNLSSQFVTTQG